MCAAMGRRKGNVEKVLDPKQVTAISSSLQKAMPDLVKGAISVDPGKMFNQYASFSALFVFLFLRSICSARLAFCMYRFAFDVHLRQPPLQRSHQRTRVGSQGVSRGCAHTACASQ